MLQNQTNQQ